MSLYIICLRIIQISVARVPTLLFRFSFDIFIIIRAYEYIIPIASFTYIIKYGDSARFHLRNLPNSLLRIRVGRMTFAATE